MVDFRDEAAEAATLAEQARKARLPCPRCRGRMLSNGAEGDLACFSCGHLIYRWAPELEDLQPRRRGASSGGRRLD
jgi:tRNA(Ile2) C34 agmatinyltransferase TiaS